MKPIEVLMIVSLSAFGLAVFGGITIASLLWLGGIIR